MDMRGWDATPRRPSGHLQKQNGYLDAPPGSQMAARASRGHGSTRRLYVLRYCFIIETLNNDCGNQAHR